LVYFAARLYQLQLQTCNITSLYRHRLTAVIYIYYEARTRSTQRKNNSDNSEKKQKGTLAGTQELNKTFNFRHRHTDCAVTKFKVTRGDNVATKSPVSVTLMFDVGSECFSFSRMAINGDNIVAKFEDRSLQPIVCQLWRYSCIS